MHYLCISSCSNMLHLLEVAVLDGGDRETSNGEIGGDILDEDRMTYRYRLHLVKNTEEHNSPSFPKYYIVCDTVCVCVCVCVCVSMCIVW